MTVYSELESMMIDMKEESELYRPTPFWEVWIQKIIESLEKYGVENFRALETNLLTFVPVYASFSCLMDKKNHQYIRKAADWFKVTPLRMENHVLGKFLAMADYRTFMASSKNIPPFTDMVSESQIGSPLEQFEFDGRKFSKSFLNYLLGINFLKKHADTRQIRAIMEIGGGFGSLGEILLGDSRNHCFYIDVDIPPLAFVSAWYLKQIFGEKHVGSYKALKNTETLSIEELKTEYKAVSLCAWQLPKLSGKIDLFVNFISFQEMEPAIVENYCSHIRRLSPDFVLLRNLQEGKQKKTKERPVGVETPITGNDYDMFFPDYELVDTDTTVFGFLTDDGFHSELRLYKRSGK